ncbi:GPI-anchored wall transfer protein 1 [Diplonema papillatum]|nr:GPI-anchored wall transfer protein 1 [Diplonema papillatum]
MDGSYKAMAEARVTGHDGGALWEQFAVTLVMYSSVAVRAALPSWVPDPVYYPLVLAVAVYRPVVGLALFLGAFLRLISTMVRPGPAPGVREATTVSDRGSVVPALTPFRGLGMLLTVFCILAVDFRTFPEQHMKTEVFGLSLMDFGVGYAAFLNGVTMQKHFRGGTAASKWLFNALPLVLIGAVRAVLVKTVNYHEHVTEYGVHWNFFFTLGLIPLLAFPFVRFAVPMIPAAVVLASVHQWWLASFGGTAYLLAGERSGLVELNKEGLFSLPGYAAVFCCGVWAGETLRLPGDRKRADFRLGVAVLLAWTFSFLSQLLVQRPSRRFCNVAYQSTCVALSLTAIFLLSVSSRFDPGAGRQQTSPYLTALSAHALPMFLVANVATGVVNLSIRSLDASPVEAAGVLAVYLAAVTVLSPMVSPLLRRAFGKGKTAQD